MEASGEASTWISSATSYDHLSNAPYSQYSLIIIAKSRLSVNWKYKKPFPLCLTGRTGCAIFISNLKYVLKGEPMAQNRQDMGSGQIFSLTAKIFVRCPCGRTCRPSGQVKIICGVRGRKCDAPQKWLLLPILGQ